MAAEGQQHPISIYLWIWGLLFVLSAASYMVDYLQLQGYLRWGLIILFMMLKAGLIVSIFMHMMWERLAIVYAVLVPPLVILVLILLMALEGDYTSKTRESFFSNWQNFSHYVGGEHSTDAGGKHSTNVDGKQ